MKIISDSTLEFIKRAQYEKGYALGKQHGRDVGIIDGEMKARREAFKYNLRSFKEAPVTIESIELKKDAGITYHSYQSVSYNPAFYLVKFRSKSGTTSEMTVSFDTPDFSMADIRRKITEEFCGGGC